MPTNVHVLALALVNICMLVSRSKSFDRPAAANKSSAAFAARSAPRRGCRLQLAENVIGVRSDLTS
jgi:hypothetical protein